MSISLQLVRDLNQALVTMESKEVLNSSESQAIIYFLRKGKETFFPSVREVVMYQEALKNIKICNDSDQEHFKKKIELFQTKYSHLFEGDELHETL